MANIVGPLIGAAVDRRDGDSGIKGAVIGSLVQSTIGLVVKLGLIVGVGLAVKKIVSKLGETPAADASKARAEL